MGDPRKTGISSITDRIVYVRHASPIEREIVAERLSARGGAVTDPLATDIAVAAEDERLIGFAVLQRSAKKSGAACLALAEEGRRRGIGGPVLQHLLDHARVSRVLAGRESSRYLGNAGFSRVRGSRGMPHDSGACSIRGAAAGAAALYERTRFRARKGPQQ